MRHGKVRSSDPSQPASAKHHKKNMIIIPHGELAKVHHPIYILSTVNYLGKCIISTVHTVKIKDKNFDLPYKALFCVICAICGGVHTLNLSFKIRTIPAVRLGMHAFEHPVTHDLMSRNLPCLQRANQTPISARQSIEQPTG